MLGLMSGVIRRQLASNDSITASLVDAERSKVEFWEALAGQTGVRCLRHIGVNSKPNEKHISGAGMTTGSRDELYLGKPNATT